MDSHTDGYFLWYQTIMRLFIGPPTFGDQTIEQLKGVIEKIEQKEIEVKDNSISTFFSTFKKEVVTNSMQLF